ncbi:hypothetical protein DAPPUDRAFT_238878 [Daphnia pulex]|uniref:Uncharacterized protein n=1 Tax=Daphnia pulex TaxID=6669 RepID=E9G7N6_DAPPU|nr:hypothetical protein DAPPUDRAFT_238878 [Daphnia pulex]|eukprot:EFX84622.1 hypothetical protein DAPPUDRAFT_238878 [Daphnia pulex]
MEGDSWKNVSLLNQSNGVDGGAIIYHGASTLKSSTPQKRIRSAPTSESEL